MADESKDIRDDKIGRFSDLLLASGLVSRETLQEQLREFFDSAPEPAFRSDDQFAQFLVTRKVITAWQANKLREGRYKGFFVDHYVLIDHVRVEESHTVYLALDTTNKRRVMLRVVPRCRAPSDRVQYEVIEGAEP